MAGTYGQQQKLQIGFNRHRPRDNRVIWFHTILEEHLGGPKGFTPCRAFVRSTKSTLKKSNPNQSLIIYDIFQLSKFVEAFRSEQSNQ